MGCWTCSCLFGPCSIDTFCQVRKVPWKHFSRFSRGRCTGYGEVCGQIVTGWVSCFLDLLGLIENRFLESKVFLESDVFLSEQRCFCSLCTFASSNHKNMNRYKVRQSFDRRTQGSVGAGWWLLWSPIGHTRRFRSFRKCHGLASVAYCGLLLRIVQV